MGGAVSVNIRLRGWTWIHDKCTLHKSFCVSFRSNYYFPFTERNVLAPVDGQVCSQLECTDYSNCRVYFDCVAVRVGTVSQRYTNNDRSPQSCMGLFLVMDVATNYTICIAGKSTLLFQRVAANHNDDGRKIIWCQP